MDSPGGQDIFFERERVLDLVSWDAESNLLAVQLASAPYPAPLRVCILEPRCPQARQGCWCGGWASRVLVVLRSCLSAWRCQTLEQHRAGASVSTVPSSSPCREPCAQDHAILEVPTGHAGEALTHLLWLPGPGPK